MAGLTGVGGGNVIARFAGGGSAVMTADTTAGHAAVIEGRVRKTVGVVAVITGITALDMVRRFTRCGAAVMTTDTAALNFGMVNTVNRCPATRSVTGFTEISGRDVITRFTSRLTAVMTADATSSHTTVVKCSA